MKVSIQRFRGGKKTSEETVELEPKELRELEADYARTHPPDLRNSGTVPNCCGSAENP